MAEQTNIEWCDSTFNPVWGCQKVSPACDNCYAEALDNRTGGGHWGPHAARRRTSTQNWNKPRKWNRDADKFFAEHGRKRRVFCASMADVFDNKWEKEWRDDLWQLIRECPDMNWLLLTKRPQNIEKMKPDYWDEIKGHIWLGTTVENQEVADQNIVYLLGHDSAVRFLSIEPMLGPIDVTRIDLHGGLHIEPLENSILIINCPEPRGGLKKINWVIAGGESGPNARPTHPDWFRSLRDQCAEAGVPFLFKQWGNWCADDATLLDIGDDIDGFRFHNWDGEGQIGDTMSFKMNKKAAGRSLDGRTHDEFPKGEQDAKNAVLGISEIGVEVER